MQENIHLYFSYEIIYFIFAFLLLILIITFAQLEIFHTLTTVAFCRPQPNMKIFIMAHIGNNIFCVAKSSYLGSLHLRSVLCRIPVVDQIHFHLFHAQALCYVV